jgi:hypothetical protein
MRHEINVCLKTNFKKCAFKIPILVFGADYYEQSQHIHDAQFMGDNHTNLAPVGFNFSFSHRPKTQWYIGEKGCTKGDKASAEAAFSPRLVHCDEFPMNSMDKGGKARHANGWVSLRYIPGRVNSGAGKKWGLFADRAGLIKNPKKSAIVIGLPSEGTTRSGNEDL